MKKSFLLILVGVLTGSTLTLASPIFFPDVPDNQWYTDPIESLSEKGIILGFPDGKFHPERPVNRAELAVMLDRTISYLQNGNVSPQPETIDVSIKNFAFTPATITIKTGTTVTWTNDDSNDHTVTSTDNFDSGHIAPREKFSHTFNQTGTFDYFCEIHPEMKGKIIVVAQ